ncbi:class I SAM-dependent methyltransferase [Paenibacillus thalictri]|uniref:Class I SAM-dependent methyltransferase n=1 Tax=Paenibacillus thalictri TaxID=2527873 RepID=A0A4Q9DQQ9_9BACL|nr:class I SAM-dependent methyltransferase [Paenibacillus thalictri]TBL78967.1 class I SAM-dependent methyltransferase [Paenibacillus thalictri]
MSVQRFYDDLTEYYHLIYANWDASLRRQGKHLDAIIRAYLPNGDLDVLDAACGIGTQSIGLALSGAYRVTASDLSPASVERAQKEASARGAAVAFSAADMRHVFEHHGRREFDVVLACDNAVPHLPDDGALLHAVAELHRCTKQGGLCLISVRDYSDYPGSGTQVHHYGVREQDGKRYVLLQVWDMSETMYHTDFYVIEDDRFGPPVTRLARGVYYPVTTDRLAAVMQEAGFSDVRRLDEAFFQPILVGVKKE